jgi:hypothetical protein
MTTEQDMTALAIPEAYSLTPAQFKKAVADGQAKAEILKDIVESAGLYTKINSKPYLHVEAWQTIGQAYGYTAKVEWSHQIEGGGWEARAVVIDAVGNEVGAAEAEAGTYGDHPWDKRPNHQVRSMAQTRAVSKALRSLLSWVVVLAGYEATPADEMTPQHDDGEQSGAGQTVSVKTISEPQRGRLFAIMKANHVPDHDVRMYIKDAFNIDSTKDLTIPQYDELVEWVEARGERKPDGEDE